MSSKKYKCAKCGYDLSIDAKYCSGCGAEIDWQVDDDSELQFECGNCGATVGAGAKYCPECGKEIDWDTPTKDATDGVGGEDDELSYDYSDDEGVQNEDDIMAVDSEPDIATFKKYGIVEVIRAKGCTRRTSITGKIVFSKYDDFPAQTKTIVLLEKGWSNLTPEDKVGLLRELGIEDYSEKVSWWSRTIGRVKAPRYPYEEWNWIDGFTFLDSGIIIHRRIDFTANKQTLKIIKGPSGVIKRAQIDKENSDNYMEGVYFVLFILVFLFIVWLISQIF